MTLSLGGEYLGSCFIQPDVFYTRSLEYGWERRND